MWSLDSHETKSKSQPDWSSLSDSEGPADGHELPCCAHAVPESVIAVQPPRHPYKLCHVMYRIMTFVQLLHWFIYFQYFSSVVKRKKSKHWNVLVPRMFLFFFCVKVWIPGLPGRFVFHKYSTRLWLHVLVSGTFSQPFAMWEPLDNLWRTFGEPLENVPIWLCSCFPNINLEKTFSKRLAEGFCKTNNRRTMR